MIRPPSRITLTHIKDVIYSAFKGRAPVPLGRWYICENKNTGLIADYSNEDHCGPCGSYATTVVKNKNENIQLEKELEFEFQHMMANTYTPDKMKNR
jgi:hypothetical protein